MSFTRVALRGAANATGAGTTVSVSPSSNLTAGQLVIVYTLSENDGTTSGASAEHSITDSLTDSPNVWNELVEERRSSGAAQDGVVAGIFWCLLAADVTTGDSITLTLPTGAYHRALSVLVCSTTGSGVLSKGGAGKTGSSTSPSATYTPAGISAYTQLWLGNVGRRGPTSDSYTADADFTDDGQSGDGTSTVSQVSGDRINNATTSDTYNPTLGTSRPWAAVVGVLVETPSPLIKAPPLVNLAEQSDAEFTAGPYLARSSGGLGNALGLAAGSIVPAYVNSSLVQYSLVKFRTNTYGGLMATATTASTDTPIGVVIGRIDARTGALLLGDVPQKTIAAVQLAGLTKVIADATVVRGDFAKVSATAGQASPSATSSGSFGQFSKAGSSGTAVEVLISGTGGGGGAGVTYGTPAIVLGTAAAAGSTDEAIRRDSTIVAFDTSNPAALGTAAPGSVAKAARRDHVHAKATETEITLADVTTDDATSGLHGFLPKLSGTSTDVLRGDGTWGTTGASSAAQALSSGDVTTTASLADVTGCSVSLGAGTWLVAASFDVLVNNAANDRTFEGHLDVGGTDQTLIAELIALTLAGDREQVAQIWKITLTGTTTVKLRTKHSGGTVGDFTVKANSSISAWRGAGSAPFTTVNITLTQTSGSSLDVGVWIDAHFDNAYTLAAVGLYANASGSVVVDLWKDIEANFPPTVADTMIGGGGTKPTLSSAVFNSSVSLAGWASTSFAAGDVLRVNVDSASSITRLLIVLKLS